MPLFATYDSCPKNRLAFFWLDRHTFLSMQRFVAFIFLTATATWAADPAGLEFFEKKIRPVLVSECYPVSYTHLTLPTKA